MTTDWRPLPSNDYYQITRDGRVRGRHRIITRSNGRTYTARARELTPQIHPRTGLSTVMLSRAGHHYRRHIHLLVRKAFGVGSGVTSDGEQQPL
jgi:hypothetical protein